MRVGIPEVSQLRRSGADRKGRLPGHTSGIGGPPEGVAQVTSGIDGVWSGRRVLLTRQPSYRWSEPRPTAYGLMALEASLLAFYTTSV